MKVSAELLEFLACPNCESRPALTESEKGLECEQCKTVYDLIPASEDVETSKVIPSLM